MEHHASSVGERTSAIWKGRQASPASSGGLVLQHAEIPPRPLPQLSPHIEAKGTRLRFPTDAPPGPPGGRVRQAGVSAFGWSGTNAHVVLEEAPATPARVERDGDQVIVLPVSARSEGALAALVGAWRERLAGAEGPEVRDLCFTAALRRSHHDRRVAAAGRTGPELATGLEASLAARAASPSESAIRVAFVFPGQGSQWLGMGRSLLREEPAFREAIERCDAAIAAEAGWSLVAELQAAPEASRLRDIDVVQPTLFAVEVALAELWHSWGIVPDAVVGHSMGEVAAAHVAGALSLEDATRVICRRSRLLRGISGRGAMAVVELSVEETARALAGHEDAISVAVSNGPRSTVISGDPRAIEEVLTALQARDVFCRPVKVDVASHSPQVDGLRAALLGELAGLRPAAAKVPIFSTVTASVRPGEQFDGEYWVRNLREPVRFFDALRALLGAGHSAFVEASPHPILLPAVEDAITHAEASAVAVPSLRRDEDERGTLLAGLAVLYAHGADPAWSRLLPEGGAFVAAPSYPWQRERFWLEDDEGRGHADVRVRSAVADHPLLGSRVEVADLPERWVWENDADSESRVCQYAHVLHGRRVLGAGGYAAIALAAWATAHGPGVAPVLDLELREPLALPPSGSHTRIQVILEGDGGVATLQVHSRTPKGWMLHVRAELTARSASPAPGYPVEETRRQLLFEVPGESYYQKLGARGVGLAEGLRADAHLGRRCRAPRVCHSRRSPEWPLLATRPARRRFSVGLPCGPTPSSLARASS
jgi:acyl transferase domain-containing protein